MEVEVAEHAELEGRVDLPRRLGFGDGDGVDEVEDEFHSQECNEEAYSVENGSLGFDTLRGVSQLAYVVVEGEYRSSQI